MTDRSDLVLGDSSVGLPVMISVADRHVIVRLSGEIDIANVDAVPRSIAASLGGNTSVRIDLSEVTFVDASLLRMIVLCRARLAAIGVDVKVRDPSPPVRRIFELTRLTHLVE